MFLRTGDMLWGQPGTLLQLLTSVYDPVQLCYYMLIITNSQPRPKPGKGRLSVVKGRRLDSMSQGSSGGGSSWHYTAVSVLAGVGAGCVLGVLGARLLWRKRRPSSRSRVSKLISLGLPHACGHNLYMSLHCCYALA